MKVHKGDLVQAVNGKHASAHKRGRVREVFIEKNRIVVEGMNLRIKHTRGQRGVRQAGIIEIEGTMDASNVMVVCPKCDKAVRVGHTFLPDGSKVRQCRNCQELLDDPDKRWPGQTSEPGR
ncbi:MAG: 50S ribosomal protein L24 [Chloroflexota bacterium]|nr:50S ribosomal protein L24 [Chloroflexota bacterium]